MPNTTASISRSMFEYLISVAVSDLEANAIGRPSCRSTAPRATPEASTSRMAGLRGLYYARTDSDDIMFLRASKSSAA